MSGLFTRYKHETLGDEFHVISTQDVEPYLEENKRRRDDSYRGGVVRHKWSLPAVMVEKFYAEYTGGQYGGAYKPMNQEFWVWVDKKIMSDPDLKKFKTFDSSGAFFLGAR